IQTLIHTSRRDTMAVQTYKELAEIYAARISKCKDGDMRVIELNKIWMEIQTLTVDGNPLTEHQRVRMLEELKKALTDLGYDDDVIALEHYSGREDYEALAKSGSSISNDEILAMMRMVAKGPKP
ncbi:hypothetical protein, partial [Klebsiella variicola]